MSHTSMCLHSAVALNLLFSRHIEGEMAEIRGEGHTPTSRKIFSQKGSKLWTIKSNLSGPHLNLLFISFNRHIEGEMTEIRGRRLL